MTCSQEFAADQLFLVKQYCVKNYNNGWCDLVIETLEDAELAEIIKGAKTAEGAIRKARAHFRDYAAMRSELSHDF